MKILLEDEIFKYMFGKRYFNITKAYQMIKNKEIKFHNYDLPIEKAIKLIRVDPKEYKFENGKLSKKEPSIISLLANYIDVKNVNKIPESILKKRGGIGISYDGFPSIIDGNHRIVKAYFLKICMYG